jgi:cell division control protein 24
MDLKKPDVFLSNGLRKGNSIQEKLSLFTQNLPTSSGAKSAALTRSNTPQPATQRIEKPFVSLYERTMTLIGKLYSIPDFEFYLFPDGIDALVVGNSVSVIDPIAILWHCFRLGAPLCHLLNQLRPRNLLDVPDVSGLVYYTNVCKKAIYRFLIGVKEELNINDDQLFTISELYKDDTNGLVKVINSVNMVLDQMDRQGIMPPEKKLPFSTSQTSVETTDNRSKSVAELLVTERKYIEALQELMIYQDDLIKSNAISKDLIHLIFANLNELLDFQRRFLFSLEATLALPPEDQHIGAIFIQYVLFC